MATESTKFTRIRALIKEFPQTPGVYLMKDTAGVVLYIGKAKSLRDRVSSYFQPSADLGQSRGPWIVEMIQKVADISYLECDSEVDAILSEARLIKDIQPAYNSRQTDDKSFPYLEITVGDDFPGVYITRSPRPKGSKLYGPFLSAADLRRVVQVLQRVFKFRTCGLEIEAADESRRYFRPCILYDIHQCSGPCADHIAKEPYRQDIQRLKCFLESKRSVLLRQLHQEMQDYAKQQNFEEAARIRDEIQALETLDDRGDVDEHVQPEVFQTDPAEGLQKLSKLLGVNEAIRVIEGIDIAHIQGQETVGALVCFIDGRPFKERYRRFRIRHQQGIDDYLSIQEVVQRRLKRQDRENELMPDLLLIDGGLGQLHAALDSAAQVCQRPPLIISLAKKEELLFLRPRSEPVRLGRHDPALRLLQYIRDEAHRFAQHYFHILQQKRTFE